VTAERKCIQVQHASFPAKIARFTLKFPAKNKSTSGALCSILEQRHMKQQKFSPLAKVKILEIDIW